MQTPGETPAIHIGALDLSVPAWHAILRNQGLAPGGVLIFSPVPLDPLGVAAAFGVATLAIQSSSGERRFNRAVIVLPPGVIEQPIRADLLAVLSDHATEHLAKYLESFASAIEFRRAESASPAALDSVLHSLPNQAAAIVLRADIYRSSEATSAIESLFKVAERATSNAETSDGLTVLVVTSPNAPTSSDLEIFARLETCGIITASSARAPAPDEEHRASYRAASAALRNHEPTLAATRLLQPPHEPSTSKGARLFIEVLRATLLADSATQIPSDTMRALLTVILRYLAARPGDGYARIDAAETLGVEIAGNRGFILLLEKFLNAERTNASQLRAAGDAEPAHEQEFKSCLAEILVSNSDAIQVGISPLPKKAESWNHAAIFLALRLMIEGGLPSTFDDSEIRFGELLLDAGLRLATAAGFPAYGLRLIGVLAGKLILAGKHQKARDLAEYALLLASREPFNSPAGQRTAWSLFGDIYLRCNNAHEALLAASCAGQISGVHWSREERHYDAILWIRIMRELHLEPWMQRAISEAQSDARALGGSALVQLRHQALMLAVREALSTAQSDGDPQQLVSTIPDLIAAQRADAEDGNEVMPVAILMAQVSAALERFGRNHESLAQALCVALDGLSGPAKKLVEAVVVPSQSAASIADLTSNYGSGRYASDRAGDTEFRLLLARRALGESRDSLSVIDSLSFLDALTDHTLRSPLDMHTSQEMSVLLELNDEMHRRVANGAQLTSTEIREAAARSDRIEEFSAKARSERTMTPKDRVELIEDVSKAGFEVQVFGTDELGVLIRCGGVNGELKIAFESTLVFDRNAFKLWGRKYPYGYHELESSDGIVGMEKSLSKLGLSIAAEGPPIIFVPERKLSSLPPNIILLSDRLAGLERATAHVPSLAWWRAWREKPSTSTGKRVAWIAPANTNETLGILKAELTPVLGRHGFATIENSPTKDAMTSSDIAILGAHGKVQPDSQGFLAIGDEKNMRISVDRVATALRDSTVAVLFVCSAGRFDSFFWSEAGSGLTRALLDRGCRAVIAPAWPLDILVPAPWLSAFLDAWERGKTVMEANRAANTSVRTKLSDNPGRFLAMNVFGDPLVRGNNRSLLETSQA